MGYELAVCSTDSDRRVLWPGNPGEKAVPDRGRWCADPRGCSGRTGKFRHSSYPIENHTTIRTETFGLKVSGKGDAKICLKNSVGQKLKIYVTDTKITVDRTMAGYKEFSEHFMTEKYSISTAARKKDGAWNLELVLMFPFWNCLLRMA